MIKKVISSILTVALLASCITFSGNESKAKADSTSTDTKQIVDPGGINEVDKDKVTTSKTIKETGVENEFEITLQVTTEENLENIKVSPDSATVLVLDTSGSMQKNSVNTTRFAAMQEAAKSFLMDFAKVESGSNAKRLVSIVSFASNVENETYSNGKNNWIDVANSSANLNEATNIINELHRPKGGTNIEGALIMANNIVKDGKTNKTLEGIENINIILLTDGCPTFHVSNWDKNTNSISTIEGVEGGSDKSYTTDWKPVGGTVKKSDGTVVSANANSISKTIKDSGTNLYTIAFSTSNEKFYTKDPSEWSWGTYENINPSDWMKGFATRNFSANNVNELTKQFETINKLIALSSKAWKVTDPMGKNIIYQEIEEEKNINSYSFNDDNKTLFWDVKNSTPTVSAIDENNNKYTYTLKYKVILDTTQKDFNYSKVLTNGDTILDYYLFSKKDDNESVELKHANFNVPKVKGLFGEFYFTKLNENNKAMANVTFTLSGTATGSNKPVVMTVTSDVNGYVSFSNIPAGEYTLTETTPSGYVTAGPWNVVVSYGNTTKNTTLGDTIINYPIYRDITVEKMWSQLPDGETDLPESVTVRLYKNSKPTDKTLVLNKSNWSGIFADLPYIDDNGVINYSVEEDKVAGYDTAIVGNENGSKFTITNSYNPELIEIKGVKTWKDKSGEKIEETVPDIEITLQRTTADNWDDESKIENVKTIKLTNGEVNYTFGNLPKTATNSKEYKYRVRESEVNGYEPTYNEKFDITNTYTPGTTEFTVNKVWNNVDIKNDVLPEVTAVLYQNGIEYRTEVLKKADNYRFTFTDLPKYAKTGIEYEYTVKERMKEGTVGYSSKVVNENQSATITNTFDTTKIRVSGLKKWANVPKGAEVPDIILRLYQNGVELTDKAVTLKGGIKENGTESYVFEDLPKYSIDGKEYVYTVKEDTIAGYTSSGEGNIENEYTMINTFTPGIKTVRGQKTWEGVADEDKDKVPNITISLESSTDGTNWTPTGKTVEVKAGNTNYQFDNLPIYSSDGKEYKYRVVETPITGYITSENGSYNILNTYDPGKTAVKVNKKWTNVDPENDRIPEVKIILKQDGTKVDEVILNSENEYTYTFENLAKYAPTGKEYEYTVDEVLDDNVVGYTKNITSGNDGFTVENIFNREATVDIPFNKVWENVSEGSEVPSITLHLYQNGVELTDKAITLDGGVKADGKESYVFKELPKYSTEGKEYEYSVKEDTVMGYKASDEGNASNNYTITNTFTPESINISGEKNWENVDKKDLSIVPTITISLERSLDGENWTLVEGKVKELTAGNTKYEFDYLPKYSSNGKEYQYRVIEEAVNGYKTSYDLEYNITNTYDPGETAVKVTKKWTNVDPNNDSVPEVKIILKQDGTKVDEVILNSENKYTHTFVELAKYAPTGKEYEYTVEEVLGDNVLGYTKEITSGNDGFTIENIFDINAVTDITFSKVWKGVPDSAKVPDIKLHLYQNGVELTDKAVTLKGGIKENGTESYVFEDLPKYSTDGTEYVYTIKEDNINGYTSSGEANVKNNYVITNTYDGGEKVVINGTKTWVNVKDVSKVPDITIRVLRDGKEIHSIIVPSGTTTYEISAESMVKYAPDGHEYEYELTEDKLDGFKSERDGYNFTNTNTVKEAVSGISDIKTGDNNMILMYSSLAILSLSLISIITLRKKKKSLNK